MRELLDLENLTEKHAKALASIATGLPAKLFIKAYFGDAVYTKRPDGKAWFCQTLETGVEISTGDIIEVELNRDNTAMADRVSKYIAKHKLNKLVSTFDNPKKWSM